MRLDPDSLSLGTELIERDLQQSFWDMPTQCAPVPVQAEQPEAWLLRSGSASEILSLTRGQLFDELLRLRDDERQRIGQELHDSAGQLLLSLQLTVACLRESEAPANTEVLLDEIRDTARLIEKEVRSLAFLNHPLDEPACELASAIEALAMGFGKRSSCRVEFATSGDTSVNDPEASMALLRIAQEALVNVHRHAHAGEVTVRLTRQGGWLELDIEDDGVGFPSADELRLHGGVGLKGMSFRAEHLGGTVKFANQLTGSRIVARIPVRERIPN